MKARRVSHHEAGQEVEVCGCGTHRTERQPAKRRGALGDDQRPRRSDREMSEWGRHEMRSLVRAAHARRVMRLKPKYASPPSTIEKNSKKTWTPNPVRIDTCSSMPSTSWNTTFQAHS